MFGAVNIFVLFLIFKIISGQQFPNSEYAQFGRNPPTSNLVHLRRHDDNDAQPLLNLQNGENVQKLVHKPKKMFGKDHIVSDDENDLGPDGPAYSDKSKKGKNVAPHNVNRIQEITGQLWPMGIVPYFVDKESYDTTTIKRIVKAMTAIESVSCVVFRELEKKPENIPDAWLYITNPNQERECVHVFSSVDGGTEVILGFDCLHLDEIIHALLHALGFRDEVTHPHRDHYIRVLWNNIQPKYRSLYRIRHDDASYKLVEYDPMSIMHFHDRAFSNNGAATIAATIPGLQIGASTTLSQLDIMRLKLAFSHECNKRNVGDLLITCKKTLIPHKNNQIIPPDEPKDEKNQEVEAEGNQDVEAEENQGIESRENQEDDAEENQDAEAEENQEVETEENQDVEGEENQGVENEKIERVVDIKTGNRNYEKVLTKFESVSRGYKGRG